MRYFLAAVHAPDWTALGPRIGEVLRCGIAGVDIRIARPDLGPTWQERKLAELVHGAGLEVRCHAWAGVRAADGTSAAREEHGAVQGRQLATWARMLGAQLASGNCERDVWRGRIARTDAHHAPIAWHANPYAVDFIDAYVSAFYAENVTAWLGDLGFADPSEHYLPSDDDADGDDDRELPEHVVMRFRRRGIMAYQADPVVVKRKLERGRKVAGEGVALSWWSSVGRQDPKTSEVVGRASTTRQGVRERWAGIDEWVGYVGFGAAPQLLEGNANHLPLVALVAELTRQAGLA